MFNAPIGSLLITIPIVCSSLISGQQGGSKSNAPQEDLERGEQLAGAKKWSGAIEEYNAALQLKPDYAEAFNDRGHAYYWTGEYDRAIADFTQAIELRPNYPNAFNNRGAAYMASGGDRRLAVADFDQAIRLKPDFRYAYINRANARGWHEWRLALADFHWAGMHPERTAAWVLGVGFLLAGAGTLLVRARRGSAAKHL